MNTSTPRACKGRRRSRRTAPFAEDISFGDPNMVFGSERFPHRKEWVRADIAVDNAEGTYCERS